MYEGINMEIEFFEEVPENARLVNVEEIVEQCGSLAYSEGEYQYYFLHGDGELVKVLEVEVLEYLSKKG